MHLISHAPNFMPQIGITKLDAPNFHAPNRPIPLLDVLSVMLTLRLAPEAVNKSGCKAGFEVGIGLCSPIPTITKLYGSVLAAILGPPSFVIVI